MTFCGKCGTENPDGNGYCYTCGSKLHTDVVAKNQGGNMPDADEEHGPVGESGTVHVPEPTEASTPEVDVDPEIQLLIDKKVAEERDRILRDAEAVKAEEDMRLKAKTEEEKKQREKDRRLRHECNKVRVPLALMGVILGLVQLGILFMVHIDADMTMEINNMGGNLGTYPLSLIDVALSGLGGTPAGLIIASLFFSILTIYSAIFAIPSSLFCIGGIITASNMSVTDTAEGISVVIGLQLDGGVCMVLLFAMLIILMVGAVGWSMLRDFGIQFGRAGIGEKMYRLWDGIFDGVL